MTDETQTPEIPEEVETKAPYFPSSLRHKLDLAKGRKARAAKRSGSPLPELRELKKKDEDGNPLTIAIKQGPYRGASRDRSLPGKARIAPRKAARKHAK